METFYFEIYVVNKSKGVIHINHGQTRRNSNLTSTGIRNKVSCLLVSHIADIGILKSCSTFYQIIALLVCLHIFQGNLSQSLQEVDKNWRRELQ